MMASVCSIWLFPSAPPRSARRFMVTVWAQQEVDPGFSVTGAPPKGTTHNFCVFLFVCTFTITDERSTVLCTTSSRDTIGPGFWRCSVTAELMATCLFDTHVCVCVCVCCQALLAQPHVSLSHSSIYSPAYTHALDPATKRKKRQVAVEVILFVKMAKISYIYTEDERMHNWHFPGFHLFKHLRQLPRISKRLFFLSVTFRTCYVRDPHQREAEARLPWWRETQTRLTIGPPRGQEVWAFGCQRGRSEGPPSVCCAGIPPTVFLSGVPDSHGIHCAAVATNDVDSGPVTGTVNFGQIKAVGADKVVMLGEIK